MPISQGLKAGLAAGVVYGAMVGLLHLGTLEACSSTQISFISQQLVKLNAPTNETASGMFATDVLYFPMIYGIWGLIYGVLYGVFFAKVYNHLPGRSSRRKGMVLGVPVFLIGLFAGPASLYVINCSPAFIPFVTQALSLPVSFGFGYILGMFYDSFGRLAIEQKEEREREKLGLPRRSTLHVGYDILDRSNS
ncbi:MAG TPA: hypothetical protein VED17_04710 [Nitrososphaerales archaeon]|nr:hypothetical protein [Nitrososphaerales archaeon]